MGSKHAASQSDKDVETTESKPKKYEKYIGCKNFTLKDILSAFFTLLIPAMIGILAVILQKNEIDVTQKNRLNDLYIGELQRESDDQQTQILANETIFNSYVKNIVDTILYYQPDGGDSPQYNITRILSLTALRQLNIEKKRLLIQFLYDVEFAKRRIYIFKISEPYEDIKNLKEAILNNVDFSNGLELPEIIFRGVSLINASFADSDFGGADFSNSKLNGANFSGTKLDGARFINTQLQQTDFQGAFLENVQFIRADLTQSNITDEQISQALAVFNTILPNGIYAKNKTFLINGDAKQGMNGWNISSGFIQVKDFYFTGNNNSAMFQRIDTALPNLFSTYESFDYCLSFLFTGQQKLSIEIVFFDQFNTEMGEKEYPQSKF